MDANQSTTPDTKEAPPEKQTDGEPIPVPAESGEQIDNVGALIQAQSHVSKPLEVSGTSADGDPLVYITLPSAYGMNESALSISFDPDVARELASMLQRQAEYAERWTEYRKSEY